jgi:hypothetical protein
MQLQVQALVARCVVCDRMRASFNSPMPQLQPLPIMGVGYRWSLDFAGPLPVMVVTQTISDGQTDGRMIGRWPQGRP